jgi:hypothetical protein
MRLKSLLFLGVFCWGTAGWAADPTQASALLLVDSAADPEAQRDEKSFAALLTALSFPLQSVDITQHKGIDVASYPVVAVPAFSAKALDHKTRNNVFAAVKAGAFLLTDGESPFTEKFKIRLAAPSVVTQVMDLGSQDLQIRWADKPSVQTIERMPANAFTVYYADKATARPLVASFTYGSGHCLYFSALFDPVSGQGYSRFPHVPNILINMLNLTPPSKHPVAEAYFDPGIRMGVPSQKLVTLWKDSGLRVIYAAAWAAGSGSSSDYQTLIASAHEKGLKVYAWFEYPHVSQRFWDKHPACREKTATLADAHIDWRYLMNLQDPACLEAAAEDMTRILGAYDWDGLNLAELYFEPVSGPQIPEQFTPMNRTMRRAFQRSHGFDPVQLFDKTSSRYWVKNPRSLAVFYRFRKRLNVQTLDFLLNRLQKTLRGNPPQGGPLQKEIVVTVIDVLPHPDLANYLGIDLSRTLQTIRRHGATLQIEDPVMDWSLGPDRYAELGHRYKQARLPRPAILDINLVPTHTENQVGFPTAQPTGMEALQLWRAASRQADRVCFYSESTLPDRDWQILPFALGHE